MDIYRGGKDDADIRVMGRTVVVHLDAAHGMRAMDMGGDRRSFPPRYILRGTLLVMPSDPSGNVDTRRRAPRIKSLKFN